MSDDFQSALITEIDCILSLLSDVGNDPYARTKLFDRLGWKLDAITGLDLSAVDQCFRDVSDARTNFARFLQTQPSSLDDFTSALSAADSAFNAVRKISDLNFGTASAPSGFKDLSRDLLSLLFTEYLRTYHPQLYAILSLLTVIEPGGGHSSTVVDTSNKLQRVESQWDVLHFDRIAKLLRDPVGYLRNHYQWNTPPQTHRQAMDIAQKLFPALQYFLLELGADAHFGHDRSLVDFGALGNEIAEAMLTFRVPLHADAEFGASLGISDASKGGLGLFVSPFGTLDHTEEFDRWKLVLKLTAGIGAFAIGPSGLTVIPPVGASGGVPGKISGELSLERLAASSSEPAIRLGNRNGTRLEIGRMQVKAFGDAEGTRGNVGIEVNASESAIVVAAGDGDSFLQRILPADGLRTNFDLGIGWSKARGVYLRGSGGLEADIRIDRAIGPVRFDSVHLGASVGGDGLRLEGSLDASAELGPLSLSIQRIGLQADLAFTQGNLGPLDFGLKFKPPTGIGVKVGAGPVSGGGFISLDPAAGRYAGALELHACSLHLGAVGVLETRLPNGEQGYSFLLLVCSEFAPVRLPFGFTLNGVGGLIGINRTLNTGALQDAVRNGGLDSVMFPKDVVKNATRIISDLRTFFPPAAGQYVVAPMVEIGWGAPTNFLVGELGLVLEFGDKVRLALLGQLHLWLPAKQAAIVELNMDVVGLLDFSAKSVSIDASLRNSRIGIFSLSGDMALRVSWGERPNFVLSVGGFHPHFTPPPGVPSLRRLTVGLGGSGNPRLEVTAYVAVTSNTLQFGANAEFSAKACGFTAEASLGFDALIRFDPFGFRVDFHARAAIRRGKTKICAISVEGTLEGPEPWHVHAKGRISILFIKVSVTVDFTIGKKRSQPKPAKIDPVAILVRELSQPANWAAELPAATERLVSLAPAPKSPDAVYLDPFGTATVRQRAVPMNHDVSRIGGAEATAAGKHSITGVKVGNASISGPLKYNKEHFAPADYEVLKDAQKLSRPSFELMDAGISLSSHDFSVGRAFTTVPEFETIFVPEREAPAVRLLAHRLNVHELLGLARAGRAAAKFASADPMTRFAPPPGATPRVQLADEEYVVVDRSSLQVRRDVLADNGTRAAAEQSLAAHVAANPGAKNNFVVIPVYEAGAA